MRPQSKGVAIFSTQHISVYGTLLYNRLYWKRIFEHLLRGLLDNRLKCRWKRKFKKKKKNIFGRWRIKNSFNANRVTEM